MKKLLFFLPVFLLTACDNNDIPKCWNDDSIEHLKSVFWQEDDGKWYVKNINNAFEIPGMAAPEGKYRYCRFKATLTNKKTIAGDYKVYKTIEKTGPGVYTHILFDTIQ